MQGTYDTANAQPSPKGEGAEVYGMVLDDLAKRYVAGKHKYGTSLRINNGRDPMVDAYQEAIDMVMYLRQAIEERNTYKAKYERVVNTLKYIRDSNNFKHHASLIDTALANTED